MDNFIVFTGGPGAGKTSVIKALAALGYSCVAEVGRDVIQRQLMINGVALPWVDKVRFRDEMVQEEINHHRSYKMSNKPVFFDRGIIDSYGYSLLEQLPLPATLVNHCRELTYGNRVFIFPPWRSIFVNDAERKQDFSEAVATYEAMVKAYTLFGYELVDVPKLPLTERVAFILATVENTK